MDPTRVRRVGAWLAAVVQRFANRRIAVVVAVVCWAFVLVSALAAGMVWHLGDRWWPATLLLFGPRWVLLVPVPLLLVGAAVFRRSLVLPLAGATILLLGPVMGFRVGWASWLPLGERDLRVMTFNAQAGDNFTPQSLPTLLALGPDILAIQECGGQAARLRQLLPDWFHHVEGQLCLSSRFPIERSERMEREGFAFAGGSGWVVRHAIRLPDRLIVLTNLHLETPRQGLEEIRSGRFLSGARDLSARSALRDLESRSARRWVDAGNGPALVTGDFNLPVESTIYQRHWGGLANAFSIAGTGFGATRFNGWIRVRIDHILLGRGWRALRAFVGPDVGSDHRPVVADLRWRGEGE